MDLLYFVDRSITRFFKALSNWAISKGIPWEIQNRILAGLAVVSFLIVNWVFYKVEVRLDLIIFLCITWILDLVIGVIGIVLFVFLHRFFDYEGAVNPNKEYQDGHWAWVCIVMAIGYIFIAKYNVIPMPFIEVIPLLCVRRIGAAIYFFVLRIERKSPKKDRTFTNAVYEQLLQLCEPWLPKPKGAHA